MLSRITRTTFLLLLGIAVHTTLPTPVAAQEVLLRMMPEAGLVSRYSTVIETYVLAPGMPDEPIFTMEGESTDAVTEVSGDTYQLTSTVDSWSVSQMPMIPMEGLPDLSGAQYTAATDSRLSDYSLVDTGTLEGTALETTEASMAQKAIGFPEEPVAVGASWSGSTTVPIPGQNGGTTPLEVSVTYTLESAEDGAVRILGESLLDTSLDFGGGMMATATGTLTITTHLDLALGRIASNESEMVLNLSMMGQAIEMEVYSTIELIPEN